MQTKEKVKLQLKDKLWYHTRKNPNRVCALFFIFPATPHSHAQVMSYGLIRIQSDVVIQALQLPELPSLQEAVPAPALFADRERTWG